MTALTFVFAYVVSVLLLAVVAFTSSVSDRMRGVLSLYSLPVIAVLVLVLKAGRRVHR